MIYEVLDTKFDVNKLTKHLEEHVFNLNIIKQSDAFGGWSVLSSTGSYADGWHKGHLHVKPHTEIEELKKKSMENGVKSKSEYVIPTEICHGYMKEVVEAIDAMGFQPQRARIIRLTANSACVWHQDMPDHIDAVRLHVPILTNAGCFFETKDDRAHMPANGSSYLVRVNRVHRVVNEGDQDRYHLVMDVVDHKNVSQFHRKPIL